MSDYDFNKIVSTLNTYHFGTYVQPIINRSLQFGDYRDLDLLFELAVDDQSFEAQREAEDAIHTLSEIPEFTKLLAYKLTESSSVRQKELIARVLQNSHELSIIDSLIVTSEKNRTNFRLRESAVWALLNVDKARAKEFCDRVKVNIVVADDEPGIRDIMCYTLELASLKVLSANNGKTAYDYTEVSTPDLLLLDIRMPRMNGYEVCRLIKENPDLQRIPVVFISAKGQAEQIREGLDAGAEEYIVKPFAPDVLVNRIKSVIRKSRLGIYNNDGRL